MSNVSPRDPMDRTDAFDFRQEAISLIPQGGIVVFVRHEDGHARLTSHRGPASEGKKNFDVLVDIAKLLSAIDSMLDSFSAVHNAPREEVDEVIRDLRLLMDRDSSPVVICRKEKIEDKDHPS